MKKNQSSTNQFDVGQFVRTDEKLYEVKKVYKDKQGNQTGMDVQEIGNIKPSKQ